MVRCLHWKQLIARYRLGDVSAQLGASADALAYYKLARANLLVSHGAKSELLVSLAAVV